MNFYALPLICAIVSTFGMAEAAHALNIIQNGSFEDSAILLASGNNLNVVVPNWSATDDSGINPQPNNLVVPSTGYPGGPDVAQDGIVYYDGNGTNVKLFQDFNISVGQTVTYSAYFSRRDLLSVTNATVKIFDITGTTLLSESSPGVNIPSTDSQENWFISSGSASLAAGNYRLQIDLPDAANVDNVVLNAVPEPSSIALLSLAGIGLFLARKRFQSKSA